MISFPARLLNDDKPAISLTFRLGKTRLVKFWGFKISFLVDVRK